MLTFALFYTSTQTSTGPTDNYIQLWYGDVKLPQQSLEGVQRTDCCHPTVPINPDLAGSQPSRQAPPRWIGHKLRFAFRWYSALLKHCRPRGQSARRTQRLPHGARSCVQKSAGASLPRRDLSKGNSTKPRPYAARVDWSQNESLSLVRLYLLYLCCCRIGQPGAETRRQGRHLEALATCAWQLRWNHLYDPTTLPSSIPRVLCRRCRSSPLSVHPSANFATVMTEWLTAAEAAAHLKVRPRTVMQWAKDGKLPGHRLSGSKRITWRFRREDLDAMLDPPSAAELRRVQ